MEVLCRSRRSQAGELATALSLQHAVLLVTGRRSSLDLLTWGRSMPSRIPPSTIALVWIHVPKDLMHPALLMRLTYGPSVTMPYQQMAGNIKRMIWSLSHKIRECKGFLNVWMNSNIYCMIYVARRVCIYMYMYMYDTYHSKFILPNNGNAGGDLVFEGA